MTGHTVKHITRDNREYTVKGKRYFAIRNRRDKTWIVYECDGKTSETGLYIHDVPTRNILKAVMELAK